MAFVPTEAFRAGLNPTPADIQRFYAANQRRYMLPEQRVLRVAKIGPEQVANVQASDKEIADYYNANKAAYAAKLMGAGNVHGWDFDCYVHPGAGAYIGGEEPAPWWT